ncbi:GNAT family N-acetyltransferase [Pigmentiphaga sp. NML080357]|uniref:GNAT family N-acetyltransferase n=1 Tax=Pigmentiphaga sp. NML080357 TaxID=2008675 RepID=UPI000B41C170|nr:GNAT family N-acetyltransferase [Pigmentiphaga sp. NML080357]OVZ64283.1 GNAT family N-acetyltransferase [Pigmentiphaga sp. NML080357]
MPTPRPLSPSDYKPVIARVDHWWGGRPMQALLPRLFFEHFRRTSFAVGASDAIEAFLIGFVSQTDSRIAYIHFVGVDPARRGGGLGRMLYEHFFDVVRALGCEEAHSITSPANSGSIAFHRKMGFELEPGTGQVDGVPVQLHHAGPGQHRVRFRKMIVAA